MTGRSLHLVMVVLGTLVSAAACVGGGDEDGTSTTTGTATTIAVASPADLASYRYTVEVRLLPSVLATDDAPDDFPVDEEVTLALEGERINPDRERVTTSADLGFLQIETESIVIGAQRWLREGNRPWVEGAASPLDVFVATDFRPSTLFGNDPAQYEELARGLAEYPSTEDEVDGVEARRFELDEAAFYELFQAESILPADVAAELSAEVWLERERGVALRMIVTAQGEDGNEEILGLEINLTDLDSEEIEIEPPD